MSIVQDEELLGMLDDPSPTTDAVVLLQDLFDRLDNMDAIPRLAAVNSYRDSRT